MDTFGGRIREQRELMGLNQIELAARLGIANTTLSQYEGNTRVPNTDMLTKLAETFGVSIDYLLRGSTTTDLPANVQAILRASKQLTDVERQSILDFIEFTRVQRRKRGEYVPGDPPTMDQSDPKDGGRATP